MDVSSSRHPRSGSTAQFQERCTKPTQGTVGVPLSRSQKPSQTLFLVHRRFRILFPLRMLLGLFYSHLVSIENGWFCSGPYNEFPCTP